MGRLFGIGPEMRNQPFGQSRRHVTPPGDDLPDGADELGRRAVLGEVSGSAGLQRTNRKLIFRVHRQDKDADRRVLPPELFQDIQPVTVGEREIEQDQIAGNDAAHELDGFAAVHRFADHDDVAGIRDDLPDPLAYDRMIAAGKSTRQISAELALSVKTVNTYRSRLLDKMNMKSAAELAAYAVRHHLAD